MPKIDKRVNISSANITSPPVTPISFWTERRVGWLGIVLSIIGLLPFIGDYFKTLPTNWLQAFVALRDLAILAGLISIIMWQMVRLTHRRRDVEALTFKLEQIESDRTKFRQQHLKSYHDTLHAIRDITYGYTFEPPNDINTPARLLSEAFKKLSSGIRELFIAHFASRGFKIGSSITITLKLRSKAQLAKAMLEKDASQEIHNQEFPDAEWSLITLARDDRADRRREIRRRLYSQTANSAFYAIIAGHQNHYTCNDLAAEGNYNNENEDWHDYYNATQAVPVRYIYQNGNVETFGVLCIDSPNIHGEPLFDLEESFHIAAFGADLAALVLHNHAVASFGAHPESINVVPERNVPKLPEGAHPQTKNSRRNS